jgi:hypothetical protein
MYLQDLFLQTASESERWIKSGDLNSVHPYFWTDTEVFVISQQILNDEKSGD